MEDRRNPLDRAFNVAVNHMASKIFPSGFDVSDNAPQDHETLFALLNAGRRMLVWSGGSDRTIFDCPSTNHAFRAWHDWCHWTGSHPFTPLGEFQVYKMQRDHLTELYGFATIRHWNWHKILYTEIIGQLEYQREHGEFPDDQRAFADEYLLHLDTLFDFERFPRLKRYAETRNGNAEILSVNETSDGFLIADCRFNEGEEDEYCHSAFLGQVSHFERK